MSNKNNDTIPIPCGCLIILFKVGIITIFWFFQTVSLAVRDLFQLQPFKDRVSEYATVPGLKNRTKSNRYPTKPYIKGKIILIDKSHNKISNIYYELPEELRATKPEEVGTIVWLKCGRDKVGSYTDGEDATVITCQVTVIDKSIPIIVNKTKFKGSEPPQVKERGVSGSGEMPTKDIVDYLRSLPQK